MICENCKARTASVIITKDSMGESAEHHLCEKCAFQAESIHFTQDQEPLSIQQFLANWFGGTELYQSSPKQTRTTNASQLECPVCKLTFEKFLDIGKFGCETCYETFRARLPHVLGKLHSGHTSHVGKIPVSLNESYAIKKKIKEVRTKMQEAVAEEQFEEAAALRDEARKLQDQLSQGGETDDVD